ncbi:MAG: hypothetical protein N2C12_04465, partial [Planctomycetales bacterium]
MKLSTICLRFRAYAFFGLACSVLITPASAQLVPGTGKKLEKVGDTFEDPDWNFIGNWPKSTEENDGHHRYPSGKSKNGRWYEGMKRGQPDFVRRVPTPKGGLADSEGCLLMRSLQTGIPGRPSYRVQQDDFIADTMYRLGRPISSRRQPSVVTRVYLPPWDRWERRNGPTFAFRIACEPSNPKPRSRRDRSNEPDTYWPGLLIDFHPKNGEKRPEDMASFRIRASRGGDYRGPSSTKTGWWTLGMSVTSDGMVHYYAKSGIEDLTEDDRIASQYPYGFRAREMRTFFFNVLSADDGKTWST